VICTDVPSMTHLAQNGINALTFPLNDSQALARHIENMAKNPDLLKCLSQKTRNVLSASEYAQKLNDVYQMVLLRK